MTSTHPANRRSLVHHRDFRALWAGDALGQLGAQLATLAVPVLAVQTLAASAWEMGALTAAETAAFLLIGLPAGAWVDRMRKRRVLVLADLVRAATLATVVACAGAGVLSMPVLYASALVMSCATVFFDVAHQSYVPGLVGIDRVVEGNAKLQSTASVAQVAGPALGGLLLRVVAAPALMAVDAVTYLLSVVCVSRIRTAETLPPRDERKPLVHEIREGLSFVAHQPLLVRIVACTSIGNLGWSIVSALLTLYALRDLGLSPAGLGVAFSAASVGGLLGALTGEHLGRLVGEARVIPLSAFALSLPMACVPLAGVLPWSPEATLAVGLAAAYFALVVFNVAAVSFRQRLCPPRLLGRMNASVRFIVWGSMPIGALLGGWLGTTLGVVPAIWVGVVVGMLAAAPVLLSPLLTMSALPSTGADDRDATTAPRDITGDVHPSPLGPATHVVVMGVAGSGKTTVAHLLAERTGRTFVEADDLHPEANVEKMRAGTPLTDADRAPWLKALRDWMDAQHDAGRSTVLTCSALRLPYRDVLRTAAGRVVFVHLDGPPELLAARVGARTGHYMPATLLPSQLATLEPLDPDEDGFVVRIDASPEEIAADVLVGLAAGQAQRS